MELHSTQNMWSIIRIQESSSTNVSNNSWENWTTYDNAIRVRIKFIPFIEHRPEPDPRTKRNFVERKTKMTQPIDGMKLVTVIQDRNNNRQLFWLSKVLNKFSETWLSFIGCRRGSKNFNLLRIFVAGQ